MEQILAKGRYDLRISSAVWCDLPRLKGQKLIYITLWHQETNQFLQAVETLSKLDEFTQNEVSLKGLGILVGHVCVGCHVKHVQDGLVVRNEVVLPEIVSSHEFQKDDNVFLLENAAA